MQDTTISSVSIASASLQEDSLSSAALPSRDRSGKNAAGKGYTAHYSLLQKAARVFAFIFSGRLFKGRRIGIPVPETASAKLVAHLVQVQKPVIFKNTASTLATPMGSYAGKPAVKNLRKMAEDQFHKLERSRETTIN